MKKAVLIVENKNDASFLEAYLDHVKVARTSLEFSYMQGYSQKEIERVLCDTFENIGREGIEKVGIMVDADLNADAKRTEIGKAIRAAAQKTGSIITSEWNNHFAILVASLQDTDSPITISAFIMGEQDEAVELEGVLQKIKARPSDVADCAVTHLGICPEDSTKRLSAKELRKLWLNFYIRYDTCGKREKYQANKHCNSENWEYIFQTKNYADPTNPIFDLDSPLLNDLKSFLTALAQP